MNREAAGPAWDCIVVGAGPAGLNAALVLGRARRRVLVLDDGAPRNYATHEMHGVLGHDGLDPAELRARGRAELAR
jgi:thioredoxin reductase